MEKDVQIKVREAELVARVKQGDYNAFDTLVEMFFPKLCRAAFVLLGSRQDAEEVVQDAFVRAFNAFDSFRGDSSFETWMHRITLNLARNRFHWNRRRGEGMKISLSAPPGNNLNNADALPRDWDLPDDELPPDEAVAEWELEHHIAYFIRNLPDKFRESLVLRHQFEMSYSDIALKTGVPVNTVKTRIKRARELLREKLQAKGLTENSSGTRRRYMKKAE